MNREVPAVVLGLFETGLAVVRSLGRNGIRVFGFDHKRDIGSYSKYVSGRRCSHPWPDERNFISELIHFSLTQEHRPVLFITADEFIPAISRNRSQLAGYYRFNLPDSQLLDALSDKARQYRIAVSAGIPAPRTVGVSAETDIANELDELTYPAVIKAREVNGWRSKISGTLKGVVAQDRETLIQELDRFQKDEVDVIVQEVIPGNDSEHYKVCCYFSEQGERLATFTLRKIRQNPIRFGVGASVESVVLPDLAELGENLFSAMAFRGVGSAEFKRDARDGKFKLIEINPRYWQQNALADKCGVNFPLMDYLSVTGQNPAPQTEFAPGVKWVNVYMDFDSYLGYRRLGALTLKQWLKSIGGKKVWSDFAFDDLLPGFYETLLCNKLLRIPGYLVRKFLL